MYYFNIGGIVEQLSVAAISCLFTESEQESIEIMSQNSSFRSSDSDTDYDSENEVEISPQLRQHMPPVSTCVDSALEELDQHRILDCDDNWKQIELGLKFFRTFLCYIPEWSKADENVEQHLGNLVNKIEAAFTDAGPEIRGALKKEGPRSVRVAELAVRSELLGYIEEFKPRIREIYEFLSEYSFKSQSPVTDFHVWDLFLNYIQANAQDMRFETENMTEELSSYALERTLEPIRHFMSTLVNENSSQNNQQEFMRDLWTHVGGVAIRSARLIYLWWDNTMIENTKSAEEQHMDFSDLQREVNPFSQQVMEVYFRVMKSTTSHRYLSMDFVEIFLLRVDCLVLKTLHEGLALLVEFLVCTFDIEQEQPEDVALISSNIKNIISELRSLKHADEFEEEVLLLKIELLNQDVVLVQLISNTIKLDTSTEKQINYLDEGLRFLWQLGRFRVPVLSHIKDTASEAKSLYRSLIANQITEEGVWDALKLLVKAKLVKSEVFLNEVGIPSHQRDAMGFFSYLDSRNFDNEWQLLWKFVLIIQQVDPGTNVEKQLILTHIEGVAKRALSFYYAIRCSQVDRRKPFEFDCHLCHNVKSVAAEAYNFCDRIQNSSSLTFPKIPGLAFVEFSLENLKKLKKYATHSKGFLEGVLNELNSLASSLKRIGVESSKDPELKDLYSRVANVAYQADYVIDSILLRDDVVWYHMRWLTNVMNEFRVINAEMIKIVETKKDSTDLQTAVLTSVHMMSKTSTPEGDNVVVALQDQERVIIDQLTRGPDDRKVVSIVGMAGIGKTTLANNVYHSPQVKNHFHIHASCTVSQVYQKRDLLLKILRDIIQLTDEVLKKSFEDLAEILYKCLKGNRYIIVLDDVWGIKAWNDLGSIFPDDLNGSRILLTSRYEKVALEAQPGSDPHFLRFLNEEESWKLFQETLFHQEECPEKLLKVGREIAKSCKGLPLSIVAIAGLLKRTEKTENWWKQIAEDLNSRILEDPEKQCMHNLELSYNHLPDDLKPCFLYFGAFVEDKEVPVEKLTWLWIAEGFIRKVDKRPLLEDVAASYLMDLISRCLVIVARRGSDGRVKSCRVHDMLHNLCLTKVQQENFLHCITGYDQMFPSSTFHLDYGVDSFYSRPSKSLAYDQHRLSICSNRNLFVMLKPSGPRVRSLLFFATSDRQPRCPYDISFIFHYFKLLRVLDIESINMGTSFPEGIELLYPLRYLAVSGDVDSIPSAIEKLWNLETLIVNGLKGSVVLPDTIWSMKRLRHLHVNSNAIFSIERRSLQNNSFLNNLVTLSSPIISSGEDTEKIMIKFRKLRKLRCTFAESPRHSRNCSHFPVLDFLTELESLKIFYHGGLHYSSAFKLPSSLKKLSLSDFNLSWDCISVIATLPKLEVLKLASIAFDSTTWEMEEEEFAELKFLKLENLEIVHWELSSDNFPKLQQLVLRRCKQLQEVPSSFGESCTLQMIDLRWCSVSAEDSVKAIQEMQREYSSGEFKVFINLPDADMRSF